MYPVTDLKQRVVLQGSQSLRTIALYRRISHTIISQAHNFSALSCCCNTLRVLQMTQYDVHVTTTFMCMALPCSAFSYVENELLGSGVATAGVRKIVHGINVSEVIYPLNEMAPGDIIIAKEEPWKHVPMKKRFKINCNRKEESSLDSISRYTE